MRASIMRRYDLDVLDLSASVVAFTFEAEIGKLHVVVDHRQFVVFSPPGDLLGRPRRSSRTLASAAVWFLEKPLVFPLEFLFQDNTLYPEPAIFQPPRCISVGRIEAGVVRQFTRLAHACVEGLARFVLASSPRTLEHVPTTLGE
jgi:hypothetical protein